MANSTSELDAQVQRLVQQHGKEAVARSLWRVSRRRRVHFGIVAKRRALAILCENYGHWGDTAHAALLAKANPASKSGDRKETLRKALANARRRAKADPAMVGLTEAIQKNDARARRLEACSDELWQTPQASIGIKNLLEEPQWRALQAARLARKALKRAAALEEQINNMPSDIRDHHLASFGADFFVRIWTREFFENITREEMIMRQYTQNRIDVILAQALKQICAKERCF